VCLIYYVSMISVTTSKEKLTLPLGLYSTEHIGELNRDREMFDILTGLSESQVADLKSKSLDESDVEIQNNTSDRERFGTGSYEQWYLKDRLPFALVHKQTGSLAAIAWFGPKSLGKKSLKHLSQSEKASDSFIEQTNWHTIVYRSYIPFRGGGLMKPFVGAVIDVYKSIYPEINLWAGIHSENPASLRLCQSLGFTLDETYSDPATHHYVLVFPKSSTSKN
jgi:RimJ/RimL family protein N-acetyltransferase